MWQNFVWVSLKNLRVESFKTKLNSVKPKYRYAICDNGTEFLFSMNKAASDCAGSGWRKGFGERWISAKEYEQEIDDYLDTYVRR